MGRAISFIFGAILIFIAIDSYFRLLIPLNILVFVVLGMGVIIMLTKIFWAPGRSRTGVMTSSQGVVYAWIRRWLFGAVLIFIALIDIISPLTPVLETLVPYLTLGSGGALIFIGLIGAIYFFSAFERTRGINIESY